MDPQEEKRERRRKKILERAAREEATNPEPAEQPSDSRSQEREATPLLEKEGAPATVEQEEQAVPKQSAFERYELQKKAAKMQVTIQTMQSQYMLMSKLLGAVYGMLVAKDSEALTVVMVLVGLTLLLSYLYSRTKEPQSNVKLGMNLDKLVSPLEKGINVFDYFKLWLNVLAAFSLMVIMRLQANYI